MSCIAQCIHRRITKQLVEQAKIDEALIWEQKGDNNPTTRKLNDRMHVVGSIGQNGVCDYLDSLGIKFKRSDYFDPNIHQDDCDFNYRGLNDVKTSPLSDDYQSVSPNSRLLIKIDSREKKVDWYTFVKLGRKDRQIHIVGVIDYESFWNVVGKPFESPRVKEPCYYILAKDLIPFEDYLNGTVNDSNS